MQILFRLPAAFHARFSRIINSPLVRVVIATARLWVDVPRQIFTPTVMAVADFPFPVGSQARRRAGEEEAENCDVTTKS